MPDTARLEDLPISEFAAQIFQEVRTGLSLRVAKEHPESDNLDTHVAEKLKEFQREWETVANAFLASLVVSFQKIACGAFVAAIRLPAEPPVASYGRVPGLQWTEVDADSPSLPASLRQALDTLEGRDCVLACADLAFCPGGTLWHIWLRSVNRDLQLGADAFAIVIGDELTVLDWSNAPVYKLYEQRRLRFSRDLTGYIRFFFHLVRGELGRFIMLESRQDVETTVPWHVTGAADAETARRAIDESKEKVASVVRPLEQRAVKASGEIVFRGFVLFRNALYQADVFASPVGLLRIENEEILDENLPVQVDYGGAVRRSLAKSESAPSADAGEQ